MNRRARRVGVAGIVVLMTLIGMAPARASVTGSFTVACQAHLPQWPSTGSSGDCTMDGMSLPGVGSSAYASGTDNNGHVWYAEGDADAVAYFSYDETCVASEPPAVGSATGTVTSVMTPGASMVVDNGMATTGQWTAGFQWTRVGATALVFLGRVQWTFGNGATATSAVTWPIPSPEGYAGGSSGFARASFTPVTSPLPTCAMPGPLDANVVAVGEFWG